MYSLARAVRINDSTLLGDLPGQVAPNVIRELSLGHKSLAAVLAEKCHPFKDRGLQRHWPLWVVSLTEHLRSVTPL